MALSTARCGYPHGFGFQWWLEVHPHTHSQTLFYFVWEREMGWGAIPSLSLTQNIFAQKSTKVKGRCRRAPFMSAYVCVYSCLHTDIHTHKVSRRPQVAGLIRVAWADFPEDQSVHRSVHVTARCSARGCMEEVGGRGVGWSFALADILSHCLHSFVETGFC